MERDEGHRVVTYRELGHIMGLAWAETHRSASPDDLGARMIWLSTRLPSVPEEAKKAFLEAFWKGASIILQ